MDNTRFKDFMKDQMQRIKVEKANADSTAGKDLGDGFIHDWIHDNSATFRENWEKDHS